MHRATDLLEARVHASTQTRGTPQLLPPSISSDEHHTFPPCRGVMCLPLNSGFIVSTVMRELELLGLELRRRGTRYKCLWRVVGPRLIHLMIHTYVQARPHSSGHPQLPIGAVPSRYCCRLFCLEWKRGSKQSVSCALFFSRKKLACEILRTPYDSYVHVTPTTLHTLNAKNCPCRPERRVEKLSLTKHFFLWCAHVVHKYTQMINGLFQAFHHGMPDHFPSVANPLLSRRSVTP